VSSEVHDHTRTQRTDSNDALDDPACIGIEFFRDHLFGVILFLGPAVWKVMADRRSDPRIIVYAQRLVTLTDWIFTAEGVASVEKLQKALQAFKSGEADAFCFCLGRWRRLKVSKEELCMKIFYSPSYTIATHSFEAHNAPTPHVVSKCEHTERVLAGEALRIAPLGFLSPRGVSYERRSREENDGEEGEVGKRSAETRAVETTSDASHAPEGEASRGEGYDKA